MMRAAIWENRSHGGTARKDLARQLELFLRRSAELQEWLTNSHGINNALPPQLTTM